MNCNLIVLKLRKHVEIGVRITREFFYPNSRLGVLATLEFYSIKKENFSSKFLANVMKEMLASFYALMENTREYFC